MIKTRSIVFIKKLDIKRAHSCRKIFCSNSTCKNSRYTIRTWNKKTDFLTGQYLLHIITHGQYESSDKEEASVPGLTAHIQMLPDGHCRGKRYIYFRRKMMYRVKTLLRTLERLIHNTQYQFLCKLSLDSHKQSPYIRNHNSYKNTAVNSCHIYATTLFFSRSQKTGSFHQSLDIGNKAWKFSQLVGHKHQC